MAAIFYKFTSGGSILLMQVQSSGVRLVMYLNLELIPMEIYELTWDPGIREAGRALDGLSNFRVTSCTM